MPIPKNLKDEDLAGRTAILDRAMDSMLRTTMVDVDLPKGTRFHISGCGKGLDVSTDRCPRCGVRVSARGIDRRLLSVPDDPDAGLEPEAYWTSQEERNDYIWARCSKCGFTVEALRCVKTGRSSNDYTGVKWPFCPRCGRRMGFRGIGQKKARRKTDGKDAEGAGQ